MAEAIAVVLVFALLVAVGNLLVQRSRARRPAVRAARQGQQPALTDPYEAAFLAGGPGRVAETGLCALLEKQRLTFENREARLLHPVADDAVERPVLAQCGTSWATPLLTIVAQAARTAEVQAIGDRLAERGLLTRPERHAAHRRAARALQVVAAVAMPVSVIGFSTGHMLLLPVFGLGVGGAVVAEGLGPRRAIVTRTGREALTAVRRSGVVPLHPTVWAPPYSLTWAVALRGVDVLPGELRMEFAGNRRVRSLAGRGGSEGGWAIWEGGGGASCGGGSSCGASSCGGGSSCGGCGGGGG